MVDRKLTVRFLPDFHATEIVEPVLTAIVSDPLDIQAAESGVSRYRPEAIVDIQVGTAVLEVWGEYDDAPLLIEGREVQIERSSYSLSDLARALEHVRSELDLATAESLRLRSHMREIEGFVTDLLRRAEVKKTMSSREPTGSDAQIDALSRVLNRVRGA